VTPSEILTISFIRYDDRLPLISFLLTCFDTIFGQYFYYLPLWRRIEIASCIQCKSNSGQVQRFLKSSANKFISWRSSRTVVLFKTVKRISQVRKFSHFELSGIEPRSLRRQHDVIIYIKISTGKCKERLFLRHGVKTGSGAHRSTYLLDTSESLSPEVKRPGREAEHSTPSSPELKNAWNYVYSRHTPLWCGT
jgi:hypothetical protein